MQSIFAAARRRDDALARAPATSALSAVGLQRDRNRARPVSGARTALAPDRTGNAGPHYPVLCFCSGAAAAGGRSRVSIPHGPRAW